LVHHEKYIDICFHFIRRSLGSGEVKLMYVPSHDQVANIVYVTNNFV